MSERGVGGQMRQRVGRRVGLKPYYRMVEHDANHCVLESLPDANRGPGLKILGVGSGIMLAATVIIGSGIVASIQGGGFGVAAISAAIAGLLVSFGIRRLIGGYAVLTTQNRLVADLPTAQITFSQTSRVGKARTQTLNFSQIHAIRLRRRPLIVGSILRQMHQIVVLELLVGENIWVVDSAQHDSDLQEVAVALHELIPIA